MKKVFVIEMQEPYELADLVGVCTTWNNVVKVMKKLKADPHKYSQYKSIKGSRGMSISEYNSNEHITEGGNYIYIKNHTEFDKVLNFEDFKPYDNRNRY